MRDPLRIAGVIVGVLVLALPLAAQTVTGTWTGAMATPDGEVPVSYTLMADGATLTGSTTGPDGTEVEISDGSVDGDDIAFSITFDFGGMPFTMNYAGVVMGDTIEFTIDVFGMPMELTVERSE